MGGKTYRRPLGALTENISVFDPSGCHQLSSETLNVSDLAGGDLDKMSPLAAMVALQPRKMRELLPASLVF